MIIVRDVQTEMLESELKGEKIQGNTGGEITVKEGKRFNKKESAAYVMCCSTRRIVPDVGHWSLKLTGVQREEK